MQFLLHKNQGSRKGSATLCLTTAWSDQFLETLPCFSFSKACYDTLSSQDPSLNPIEIFKNIYLLRLYKETITNTVSVYVFIYPPRHVCIINIRNTEREKEIFCLSCKTQTIENWKKKKRKQHYVE